MKPVIKAIKYVALLFIGLVAGIVIAGMVSGAKSVFKEDKSEAVKVVLTENCACDSVEQFIYAKGIQFSKEDGISTEKIEYELVNCQYENLYTEVARLNNALTAQVDGYEDIDILKLEFVGEHKHETITIKNGIIQETH